MQEQPNTAPVLAPKDEVRIIQAARTDPALFAPIYECYFPRIYGYCLRRLGTPQEAEDLASHVFIRAIQGLESYRGGRVSVWLFRIAHNAVINHYRSRRPQVSLEVIERDLPDARPGPGECLVQIEDWQALRALIDGLPEDQRDLLALKLTGELTSGEIGEMVGKSAGAVRVELHRIIKGLRAQYKGDTP
jgi:RNA polymerase sigma-70 factor (ECF subfamily)